MHSQESSRVRTMPPVAQQEMGGGGLDYYDPKMLLRLAGDAPPPPAEEVAKLEAEVAETKKAWEAIRGTPEGLKKAADGKPTQRPFRLKYEEFAGAAQCAHRSGETRIGSPASG